MKKIEIKKNYLYLPEYNIIINNEFEEIFKKHASKKAVKSFTPEITTDFFKQQILELPLVIFEITQDCNLRCKYCVHSGDYHYYREHTKSVISLETAKHVLNYIFGLIKIREKKEFTIGFYGGEPLLQFDLIMNIVDYSKSLFENWNLTYTITTNLTLLNKRMLKSLIHHNFSILVSLDGPQEHHDAKRVFPNDSGSFREVKKKLLLIKNEDAIFFERNVLFSSVFSQDLSIDDVFKFFTEDDLVNRNFTRFSGVNAMYTEYYKNFKADSDRYKKDIKAIQDKIKEKKKINAELKPFEQSLFDQFMHDKKLNARTQSLFFGSCIFNSRLFVDSEGRFHICERLNDTFTCGDAQHGFDYDKMKKIVNDYFSITSSACIKCDYSSLCSPCYVHFAKNKTFELNESNCRELKNGIDSTLRHMVDLGEMKVSGNPSIERGEDYTYRFHQFIILEKGPVNTAIIDFLKGDVYQIENSIVEKFENSPLDEQAEEFLKSALSEELVIKTKRNAWIPNLQDDYFVELQNSLKTNNITLELENGVDIGLIKEELKSSNITEIYVYYEDECQQHENHEKYEALFPLAEINHKKKDFTQCIDISCVDQDFLSDDVQEFFYTLNKLHNSCWYKKIAFSKKGEIKPCIYSEITLGVLGQSNLSSLFKDFKQYWNITKDNINKCRDCELRYICFDCREVAIRKFGDLFAESPNCKYNPYTGVWR